MENIFTHEIELYSFESFKTLLDHEVNMSRRYRNPLTLIHLAIETDSDHPQIQHDAEVFAINILNVQLRHTDIPCRRGNEFLVLMAATDESGGRIVCERLAGLFNTQHQTYDRVSFKMVIYVGMASLPGSSSLTADKLMQQAATAMQHARDQRLTNAVVFSEIT